MPRPPLKVKITKPALPAEKKAGWLAAWCAPDALTYRDSLRYGERLNKAGAGDFILKVIGTAEVVRNAAGEAREAGESDVFAGYFRALIDGENFEAEAERAFARAVAPLLLGNQSSRDLLRRVLDCVEQTESTPLPSQERPRRLLAAACRARVEARRAGEETSKLERILALFNADAGKPMTARKAKPLLKKMGVLYESMAQRGPDTKPRKGRNQKSKSKIPL